MSYNSAISGYIGSLFAEKALAPSAPAISAPNPFIDDERADIGFQKFGRPIPPRDSDGSATGDVFNIQGTRGPDDSKPYTGPLDVSRIYREQGAVLPEQGFFDKAYGSKPTIDSITGRVSYGMPRGMSPILGPLSIFAQFGAAANRMNLESIYKKVQAGEEGYGLAMFGNRLVGVRPGQLPQGNVPLNLSIEQLKELRKNILAAGAPTDEPAPPKPSLEERKAQYQQSPDSEALVSGGKRNIVQDDAGRPVTTTGDKPVTTSAGQYADPALLAAQADAMKAAAQQDKAPTQSAPAPAPAPSPSRPEPSGYGRDSSGSQRSDSSGYGGFGGRRATGGTVGFAEGGNTRKDPIQRTGFVEGPPQKYAKGTTVADTENLRVREGSFVINAPMTEKLQKAGVLPKGNQKRKAANGGKMMEVALSKGEYVVEPKDVPKFGGYNFLEAVNDMGKPEVERRQAMQKGGTARDIAAKRGLLEGLGTGERGRLARYDEQTGKYELAPLTSKNQQAFTEKQESFLQKQPYIHMGDVEYAQSMMAMDRTDDGYIEEGLFMDPMDSVQSFKNRGLNEVFPAADAQLINYFTEIPDITYEKSIGHPFLAGQYNAARDTIEIATRGAELIGGTPEDTAYHEILHRAFEKKFQRNLPISGSGLVEAFSYDQMFIPPAIQEDLQKLDLLQEETRFGTPEYEELQSQVDNIMSKANDYIPDQNHSALTLHVIDNTLKTVEKSSVEQQIKGLEFARRRARYYLPDPIKIHFDYSQPVLLKKKYPDLHALSDDDFDDVRFGRSKDENLNRQYINYVKDNLKTLKKIHSDATVEYRIALAASNVDDVVAPVETKGSQTYEQGFLRSVLDRNLLQVNTETEYPRYFLEQQRRKDSSATR
jgi:hypothetical protein